MMDKVLVIKQNPQQTTAGAPVFVLGGGEPERGRGVTRRERLGGFAGKQVGRILSLLQPHRNFSSFMQGLMQGGAQGEAAGRRFGRVFVTPDAQARADRKAGIQQEYARRRAAGPGEEGFSDYGITAPRTAMFRNKTDEQAKLLQQRKGAERVAVQERKEEDAKNIAAARARGIHTGTEDLNLLAEMRRQADKLGVPVNQLMSKVGVVMPHLQRLDEEERKRQINEALEGLDLEDLNLEPDLPNQDAAGNPIQPIGPSNQVPVTPATVPTVGQEIAGKEETPTGDAADHDGEYQTYGAPPQSQLPSMNEKNEEEKNNQGNVGVVQIGKDIRLTKPKSNLVGVQGQ